MALQTWTLEIRVDHDEKSKDKLVLAELIAAGQQLLAMATLLADKRKPQIALSGGDMFMGTEEIQLFKEGELDGGLEEEV